MPKRLTPKGQAAPPVEPNVAAASIPKKQPTPKRLPQVSKKPGVKYIRNIRGIQCRITLKDGKGRRIELDPRGQRGDIEIVNKQEQEDPIYLANLNLLYEEIPAEEAQEIIANQQTNAQNLEHPLWAHLRNEQGKEYTQRHMVVEDSIEEQAIVVAKVEETPAGRFTDKNSEVVRSAGPQFTEAPGSPNHPATKVVDSVPGTISPEEYHEFLMWKQRQNA